MSGEAPTYSTTLMREDLELTKAVLHQPCIRQNQTFDTSFQNRLGVTGRPSRRLVLTLSLVGGLISTFLLCLTKSNEILGRVFLGGMTVFFLGLLVVSLMSGGDWLKRAIRKRVTDPLIRSTVNTEVNRWMKLAPFSVVYRFFETSYTASSPELKSERTILGDEISIAYYSDSVFCLFQTETSQSWKSLIFAPEPEHHDVVEAFLKRNHVEVRELDDQMPKVS